MEISMTPRFLKLSKSCLFLSSLFAAMALSPEASAQDLVVSQAQEVRTRVSHGDSLRLIRTISNIDGVASGSFQTQVLISDDVVRDGGDTVLTTFSINNIPGNSQDGPSNITVTIPNFLAPGTYFILFNADSGGAVTETGGETNNLGVSNAITVEARSGDLDFDADIDIIDLTEIVRQAVGLTPMLMGNGDINGDTMVNIFDAVAGANFILNNTPIVGADTLNTNEDINTLTVGFPGLLINDTDATSETLRVDNFDFLSANGAAVSVALDGTTTYRTSQFPMVQTLALGSTAIDSFTYTVDDDEGGFTTAGVTVVIAGRNDRPVANPDSFATAYVNTLFGVGRTAPVMVAGSVLTNDTDIDIGDTLSVAGPAFNTNGATVNIMSDGTFTYLPRLNATGTQTFQYTLTDDKGGRATGTVSITIFNQRIFYVDSDFQVNGDGRSTRPFNNLNSANNAANVPGDIIYVFDDNVDLTTPGAITLLDSQQLLGNVNLMVNGTSLFTANGTPTLVGTDTITIGGQDVTVRGFNVRPSTGAAFRSGGGLGDAGTLTVNTCSVNAGSGQAFRFQPTSGTLAVSFSSLSSSGTNPGIQIQNCSGSFNATLGNIVSSGTAFDINAGNANVTYGGTITSSNTVFGLNVQNTTGGTVTLTGTINITNISGSALNFNGVAGNVSLTDTANITEGTVFIVNSPGAISINNFNVNNANQALDNQRVCLSVTNVGTFTTNSGTASSFNQRAVTLTNVPNLDCTLTSVSANGGGNSGISMTNTNGRFTVTGDVPNTLGSGGNIDNLTTAAIVLNNTNNISLENMVLGNPARVANGIAGVVTTINGAGILSTNVTNLTVLNSLISDTVFGIRGMGTNNNLTLTNTNFIDCGNSGADDTIDYSSAELLGAVQITNCNLLDNSGDIFVVDNSSSSVNILFNTCNLDESTEEAIDVTISNGTLNLSTLNCSITDIGDAGTADPAFNINLGTNGNGTFTINNTTITNIRGSAIELDNRGSGASARLNIVGSATSSFTNLANKGIDLNTSVNTSSTIMSLVDLNISSANRGIEIEIEGGAFNCEIRRAATAQSLVTSANNEAILFATINNNNVVLSPRLSITNVDFVSNGAATAGVFTHGQNGANTGIFHVTMSGSSFLANGTDRLAADFFQAADSVICANLSNNTFTGNGNAADVQFNRSAASLPLRLQDLPAATTDPAVILAFLTDPNGKNNTLNTINAINPDFAPGTCLLPIIP
jgi:VCBS repeat-containing protein